MYKYRKKIKCMCCQKNFRGKMFHKTKNYFCGGRNNYGSSFCDNQQTIQENFLDFVIERHGSSQEVKIIEIDKEKIRIIYVDGTESLITSSSVIF